MNTCSRDELEELHSKYLPEENKQKQILCEIVNRSFFYFLECKVVHLLSGVNNIFRSKSKLSSKQGRADIFHVVEVSYKK